MDGEMDEKKWTDDERDEAFDRGMETMQRVALELYRRGREPLLAELETVKRERDEARRLLELAHLGRAQLEGWRDGLERERDEARAELATLADALDDIRHQRGRCHVELKQERAEVERLRSDVAALEAGITAQDEVLTRRYNEQLHRAEAAFRRGAEAMRKRCAMWIKHNSHEDGLGMGSQRIESALAALPIPEEP